MEHFIANAQIHENSLMGQQIGSFLKIVEIYTMEF
jgi:hypothetical protein